MRKIEELTERVKDFEKANIKMVQLIADVSINTVSDEVHSDYLSPVENGFC